MAGGSLKSLSVNGREFAATADADVSRKLGGTENEISPNGNRTSRIIKKFVPGAMTGWQVECIDERGDQEFLQDIANGNEAVPCVASYIDGSEYQGTCTIVGELTFSNMSQTCSFDLGAVGEITAQ